MTTADLFQLPPVRVKLILSQFYGKDSMKHLLDLQLWYLFKYAELTEIVRQNDKIFIDFLNKVRVGNIDDDVENLFMARFIREYDGSYPKKSLHIYAESEPAMKRNEAVLNELPGELYIIEANDKISDNCKFPLALIQAAQNQKQANTGNLAKLLKLTISAKVMLTVNIDTKERLINGQAGIIRHIEFVQSSTS